MGGTNVFVDSSTPISTSRIRSLGANQVDIARSHFASLINFSSPSSTDLEIDYFASGSPYPLYLRTRFQELVSPRLFVRYGATEIGTIAIAGPGDHESTEGTVGSVVDGVAHNATTSAGNLHFKARGMARGYESTGGEAVDGISNDWFIPGDVGRLDAQGRLVLLGRYGDAFTVDGVNVHPSEVESVMLSYPTVNEVVVVAKRSDNHDGIPVAFVTSAGRIDEIEVLSWARERLGLSAPRSILQLDEIPMMPGGKIDRIALSKLVNPDFMT